MWRRSWLLPATALLLVPAGSGSGTAQHDSASELGMTPAVACQAIGGFEDYEPLPGASLTSDAKLLVYYRPINYHIERVGATYRIHLVQDAQIRRRGEKKVLMVKPKMVDSDFKGKEPAGPVYMRNTVGLKGLPPGEYDFELILHDVLAPGAPMARQSLQFKVVPPARDSEAEGKPAKKS